MGQRLKKPVHPRIIELLKEAGLPHIQALYDRVGGSIRSQTTFYNILGNENDHAELERYTKLKIILGVESLDRLAWIFLDHPVEEAAKLFQQLCLKNGITTGSALAEKLDCDPGTGVNFLRNKKKHISLRNYRDIAWGLGVSLDTISSALLHKDAKNKALTPIGKIYSIRDVAETIKKCWISYQQTAA